MKPAVLEALRRPSLLRRLVVILVLAGELVSFAVAIAVGWTVQQRDIDRTLQLVAEGLLAVVQDDVDPGRIEERARRIQVIDEASSRDYGLDEDAAGAAYQVFRKHGGMVFRTAKAPDVPLAEAEAGIRKVRILGAEWRVATAGTPDGRVWVHVGMRQADRKVLVWTLAGVNFLLVGFGVLGAAILFALAAHRGLKPLAQLAELVKRRTPGDLSPVVPRTPYLETTPLVEALNRLLAETQGLLDIQRRFIADAAHELRTPLSVVSAQAHVLGRARTEEERTHAQRELQDGLDRAALLIRQLLTVARLDSQIGHPCREQLDLDGLLRRIVAGQAPRFLDAGLDLAYVGCGPLVIECDAPSLCSAVENLLENAFKYAGEGSQVELRLSLEMGEACILVADDGPGVAPAHFPRLFERFYRVPGTSALGSGLGLSIVQRVADEHGGKATLGPGLEGRGLGVSLHIPV